MKKIISGIVLSALLSAPTLAADRITSEQIQQVINATDAAAAQRDAAAIGVYLADTFEKIIEFVHEKWLAKVSVDKGKYLELIDEGWAGIGEYDYQRENIEIHISSDGLSGQSYSTITENMFLDGIRMTSKVREYATYELENGMTVITQVSGHPLLGDTTP